jgi:hypothetical protein
MWTNDNPDLTMLFSAGNVWSHDSLRLGGWASIGSPALSRNLLTVASLGQLPVSNLAADIRYTFVVQSSFIEDGTHLYTAERLTFSQNPFAGNVTRVAAQPGHGKQCRVVSSITELENAISDAENVQFVVTTVKLDLSVSAPFAVFYISDPDVVEKNRTAGNIYVAQQFRGGDRSLGSYSSLGPTTTGI